MLEALGVSRRYGWRWALRDVSLAVSPGETLALLGKNGSGKTTLLKTLAGLLRPTRGEVRVNGEPLSREAKRGIGLLAHESMLYAGLTMRENLEYAAGLFGMGRAEAAERMNALTEALGVSERLDEPARAMSRGIGQRAALARALLHEPAIALLDEPFSGLDPEAAQRLDGVARALCGRGGRIVVFTTHDVSRAFGTADRIVVLSGGELAYDARVENADREEALAAFDKSPGNRV